MNYVLCSGKITYKRRLRLFLESIVIYGYKTSEIKQVSGRIKTIEAHFWRVLFEYPGSNG